MAFLLRPPDSRESLPETLGDLGRFRRRVAVASGLFAFVGLTVGCVALACSLDAAFGLPPLARGSALVLTLTAAGVCWLRGVSRAVTLRTDPLSVALELEERYPNLNDALASAVDFLQGDTPQRSGTSNRLRELAVRQARRAADRHDIDSLAPTGRCWRNGWMCGLVLGLTLPAALVDTDRTRTALVRLADPFGNHPWPTKTRVEIVVPQTRPARVPRGEPFELKFIVRGVIRDRAAVTFRILGGEEFTEEFPLAVGNDPQYPSAAVVAARLDPARLPSPFLFRVTSNDFEGEWHRVEVVPPPRLVPVGGRPSPQFHVTPPAYTGLTPLDLPDGAAALEVPVGTRVRLRAATDVRLSSAALAFTGDRSAVQLLSGLAPLGHFNPLAAFASERLADRIGADIPLSLDPTGTILTGDFFPALSGMYALKLTDETGLTGTRLIEVRLVPDPAPTVTLLRPSAGRDPAVLAPTAAIPVHLAADDKLYAVRDTFLEYRVGRSGPTRTVPLTGARAAATALPGVVGGPGVLARVRPTSTDARAVLPLTVFSRDDGSPLRDGDRLLLRGAADDWDDLTPAKQPGRTDEVEILIASPQTIEAWLERELAALRQDLLRLREQQRDARLKTTEVKPQPDGTLQPADRDRLLAVEQSQRLIRGKVADPNDGTRAKAEVLRETVRANNLPRSQTTDRVETVADELGRLTDRDLPAIEPILGDARQLGSFPPRSGQEKAVADLLRRALRHQKAVEDGLTDLHDLLSVWGAAGDVRNEARALRDFLLRQATDLERLERLAPAADLERAATRAEQASEQGNQLVGRALKLAAEKDTQAAQALAAAEAKAREAARLRDTVATRPPGTPDRSGLNAQAALLDGQADDLRATAAKTTAEATVLRAGVKAVGGQALPDDLRKAAAAARKDRRAEALTLLRSSAARLDELIETLAEKQPEPAPELAKKLKTAADDLDALAAAQDELRQKAAAAARLADPAQRQDQLRKLSGEQERLQERARELLQRLNRDRADAAARDVRAALDRMEAARSDLEAGGTGMRAQNDAVDRLDTARDKLDAATAAVPQQLSDEKRRKLADRVQAILDRQRGRVAEADRIHGLVSQNKGWERDYLVSYGDLAEAEKEIARDVRALEQDLAPLPVLARVLAEAAAAADTAAARIETRRDDIDPALAFDPDLEAANDRRVKRPMELAARRLEQLLDALRTDTPSRTGAGAGAASPSPTGTAANPADPADPAGGRPPDLVPPLAQLKVLRALQAELNQKTAEFAKLHPETGRLTDEQRQELKELEAAQREIAALFEHIARLFAEQQAGPLNPPPNPAPEQP